MAPKRGMSREEVKRLSALFRTYDVDNSGRIEKHEFSTICQELHVPSKEADSIFDRLDVDKDGTVTLEEFISGFKERHQEKKMASTRGMSQEEIKRLSALFHAYDADNSGCIEKQEFFTICKELRVPSKEADSIFDRLDVDKDGTVTLDEFISGFRERHQEKEDDKEDENSSESEEEFSMNREQVISSQPHPSVKGMSAEEQERLRSLFNAYDVDNSGQIERQEFLTICAELQVSAAEADRIFSRLDVDNDGTVTLLEFMSGFHDRYGEDMESEGGDVSAAWEHFERRLGEQAKFIPRHEQAATLYQNISLTEPRLINQFEKVILNFTKEIKQQNSEMENLALAIKRAQDQASMQLSEMEDEMDQRIHAAERKTREQEKRKTEAALSELRTSYETEVCELQCKIQKMKMIEEKYKNITVKDESPALKKKINELTLDNQKLKQELLKSQTKVACLHSEMDSLKTELTDQSINNEQDEELMRQFADERDALESQIEILQTANRKLHDTNDGLRAALERTCRSGNGGSPGDLANRNRSKSICYTSPYAVMDRFCQRVDDFPLYSRRPSCDTLALAMCDPGLRRRHSSECEEDSLPEIYVDSGLSTLRGSHGGYDSEQEVKGQDEEDKEEREEKKVEEDNNDSMMGENSDTEPAETQDTESAFGSDSSSVLDWKPPEPKPEAPTIRKAVSALSIQKDINESSDLGYMTSEKAYRIVLAGDAAVGKSSFLLRLCKNEFKLDSSATLGVDFQMKTFIVDGEPVLLQLWDTAGQERFRSIAKSYFRRADGVLLLYDVTCEKSFLNVREWVDMIEDVSQEDVPIMLVGNKCDLRQDGTNCVPTSYGEKLAMTYNTLFCETSAKDGCNIVEAVLHLARQVTKQAAFDEKSHHQSLPNLDAPRKKPNFSCCS
ncbi:ras and EF-hand domain-containing protein isoform X2 [Plectropomus leopardus]|uniref:ras and EF-hand domain-containing protein isoform X2 n=1 Tax=Plectropomus leopardus TaxID=160734 RepID=UPI001C4BD66B|nr:ras and EF-hand domain-containing protein isoform X2 [Plectropomus leopardus]